MSLLETAAPRGGWKRGRNNSPNKYDLEVAELILKARKMMKRNETSNPSLASLAERMKVYAFPDGFHRRNKKAKKYFDKARLGSYLRGSATASQPVRKAAQTWAILVLGGSLKYEANSTNPVVACASINPGGVGPMG